MIHKQNMLSVTKCQWLYSSKHLLLNYIRVQVTARARLRKFKSLA